ncbi:MAG: SRPBCC domain-containing protein [Saprospiraceae bacterium]|nr:SRPBCC domain-containing protein [Bacteroidia bacterium]NNE14896.1 SRPBCC domain-containing protein [Saprospiraceae bacterium]NNL91837.1 SRPBCC domain-containing protein [Saprospiraceae bacterium]
MKTLNYKIIIHKPASQVYDVMLGLSDKSTYEEWTSIFSPTSSYQGNWEKGNKMLFVSKDKDGNLAGMVSRILANDENKFVSIQHYGMLKSGEEITEGPEVEGWAGSLENYTLTEADGDTTVTINIDAAAEHEEYMDKLYPGALQKLKEICESK